jgi:hypothetical protein
MCGPLDWSRIGAVDRQTIVIRLELHPDDESLSGRASDTSGVTREFVGWMGLVAAIDALVPASIKPQDEGEPSRVVCA